MNYDSWGHRELVFGIEALERALSRKLEEQGLTSVEAEAEILLIFNRAL